MKELNKVSIWVGDFKSVESFYEFIEYSYDDLTEDLIDSKFGEFFSVGSYDEDFAEGSYQYNLKSVQELLLNHSYMNEKRLEFDNTDYSYNCVYLIYDYFYEKSNEIYLRDGNRFQFFGSFDYKK